MSEFPFYKRFQFIVWICHILLIPLSTNEFQVAFNISATVNTAAVHTRPCGFFLTSSLEIWWYEQFKLTQKIKASPPAGHIQKALLHLLLSRLASEIPAQLIRKNSKLKTMTYKQHFFLQSWPITNWKVHKKNMLKVIAFRRSETY